MDLSTPSLAQFLAACRTAKVSVARVRALAGVDPRSFKTLHDGRARRSVDMLVRLTDALASIKAGTRPRRKPDEIAALVRATERVLQTENALAQLTLGSRTIPDERVRSYAIYIAAVEIEVENATLARALYCKRQHIHQTRKRVHDWRDEDAAVDALVDRVARLLKGE